VGKAAVVRPAITATTGGAANVPVSIAEDVTSTAVSVLAIIVPVFVGILLIVGIAFLISWWWNRPSKT
jgi:hypothetical protein